MKNKSDIEHPKDIKFFVDSFYKKVLQDDILKVNFIDMDWKYYLPFMYKFWESIAFPLEDQMSWHKQIPQLDELHPLPPTHFQYCVDYFNASVDAYFEGMIANTVKQRAQEIADILGSNRI